MSRTLVVALCSLLFIHLFFIEYRPGIRRVEIPYDLSGFHYPLADYAFQSLRQGRFPEWDPTIYSGLPFAANVQAALFYPPSWALFAVNAGRERLRYQSLQDFVFLHVWLALVLCYAWLKWRRMHPLAALLGSGVFALSGYSMLQLQHLGVISGYAWMPLAFWGIDHAHEENRWWPLWKTAAASAMCFLAGYTPMWTVFAVCVVAYAVARRHSVQLTLGAAGALAVSLLLSAVQLVPALEASSAMIRDTRYGFGIRDPMFYVSYIVPNFWNFGLDVPVGTNLGYEYLYLGCAGLVGIVVALTSRVFRMIGPAIGVIAVSAFFLINPFKVLNPMMSSGSLLSQAFRDWYFLAGISAGSALLAALGLNRFMSAGRSRMPAWVRLLVLAATGLWCGRLLWIWASSGAEFASGWWSGADVVVSVALFAALGWLYSSTSAVRFRLVLGLMMIVLVAVEYKAFGTSRRFNAARTHSLPQFPTHASPWIDEQVYREMRRHPEYRIALDAGSYLPTDLRHMGLSTPQGIDPFLPAGYRRLAEQYGNFSTDRVFEITHDNRAAMQLFGVRYYISNDVSSQLAELSACHDYKLLRPTHDYLKVFELRGATPAYAWLGPGDASVALVKWSPQYRAFSLKTPSTGRFRLSEQFFPGWTASVDGSPVVIERCHEALQCINVPAGEHRIEFRYRSQSLRLGAAISAVTLLLCAGLWLYSSGSSLRRTASLSR